MLPTSERRGIDANECRERLLAQTSSFPHEADLLSYGCRLRPGVVAQEAEDRRPEANVGLDTALLPIEKGAGVAADLLGSISLLDAPFKAGALQVLAHRPGLLGAAGARNPASKGQ
jgi:hypothetical protein